MGVINGVGTTMRIVWLTGLLVALAPAVATGQPCGGHDEVRLGETLGAWTATHTEQTRIANDGGATANERVAAFKALLGLAQEMRRRFGICDRPGPREEQQFRTATGRSLLDARKLQEETLRSCSRFAAAAHLSPASSAECWEDINGHRDLAWLVPAPLAAWAKADANTSAALYGAALSLLDAGPSDIGARRDVAAMQLASGDFRSTLRTTFRVLEDTELLALRSAALAGLGRWPSAERVLGRLVRDHPMRPDFHFNLAALVARVSFDQPVSRRAGSREAQIYRSSLAFLCLTDAADDPPRTDRITDLLFLYNPKRSDKRLPLRKKKLGRDDRIKPGEARQTCADVLRNAAPRSSK